MGPCLIWGMISTTCVISMWRNDIKCKYMFYASSEKFSTQRVNTVHSVVLFYFTDLIMCSCRFPQMSHLLGLTKVCAVFISSWLMVTYINNVFNRDGTRMAVKLSLVKQGRPITDDDQSIETPKQVIYWVLSAKSFLNFHAHQKAFCLQLHSQCATTSCSKISCHFEQSHLIRDSNS